MTFFKPPIFYHHWLPAYKISGGWATLEGDFPYYHVKKSIFEALNNGLNPSSTNPFATIAWVNQKIEENKLKCAYGKTGTVPYNGANSRHVNFLTGVSEGGSYIGDTNFNYPPAVILSVGQTVCTQTDHHGFSTGITSLTPDGMDITITTNYLEIDWVLWLAVGR